MVINTNHTKQPIILNSQSY